MLNGRLNSSSLNPIVSIVEELEPRGLLPQVEGLLGGVEQLLAGEGVAAGAGDAPAQPLLAPAAALQGEPPPPYPRARPHGVLHPAPRQLHQPRSLGVQLPGLLEPGECLEPEMKQICF